MWRWVENLCKVFCLALSIPWTVKIKRSSGDSSSLWKKWSFSPFSTVNSQRLEGTMCVPTENLFEATGDVLLGPAVLRVAFGTCKRERRSLSPAIFP